MPLLCQGSSNRKRPSAVLHLTLPHLPSLVSGKLVYMPHQIVMLTVTIWQELEMLKSAHGQLQEQCQPLSQQLKPEPQSNEQDDAIAQLTRQLQQAGQDMAGQRAKTMALQQVLLHLLCLQRVSSFSMTIPASAMHNNGNGQSCC